MPSSAREGHGRLPVAFGTRERASRQPGKLNPSSIRLEDIHPLQALTL